MTVAVTYAIAATAPVVPVALPSGAGVASAAPAFLGNGLTTPFQRGASDFNSASGVPLVSSCVEQVVGTQCDSPISSGELPWRTEFGTVVRALRNRNNTGILRELARAYCADGLSLWEPRVTFVDVDVVNPSSNLQANKRTLALSVTFGLIGRNVPPNQVALPGLSVTVPLQ